MLLVRIPGGATFDTASQNVNQFLNYILKLTCQVMAIFPPWYITIITLRQSYASWKYTLRMQCQVFLLLIKITISDWFLHIKVNSYYGNQLISAWNKLVWNLYYNLTLKQAHVEPAGNALQQFPFLLVYTLVHNGKPCEVIYTKAKRYQTIKVWYFLWCPVYIDKIALHEVLSLQHMLFCSFESSFAFCLMAEADIEVTANWMPQSKVWDKLPQFICCVTFLFF